MRTTIKILGVLAALAVAALAFFAIQAEDKLTAFQNAQRTFPARMAKLNKLREPEPELEPEPQPQPLPTDEKLY